MARRLLSWLFGRRAASRVPPVLEPTPAVVVPPGAMLENCGYSRLKCGVGETLFTTAWPVLVKPEVLK